MEGGKDRENEIGHDKERTPLTVQASFLMTIYRQNDSKYQRYLLNLLKNRQGEALQLVSVRYQSVQCL